MELFLRDHGKVDRPNIRCDRDAKRAGNARLAEPRRARTSISAAFLFIELRGARPELAWWNALKERITPKPKYHVVPKTGPRRPAESDDVYSSIDPILDKITKFGIGSLTPSERRQLNREREQLLSGVARLREELPADVAREIAVDREVEPLEDVADETGQSRA